MSAIVIAAFLQAALFQIYYLVTKRLQEKGMSNITVLYYQRFAVIPGALLLAATFRKEYLAFLFEHPLVLGAIIFCSLVWILHFYIRMYIMKASSSMSFLNAFSAMITIPLLLVIGIAINRDFPNTMILIGICLLLFALMIRPTPHKSGRKKVFSIGIFSAIALTILGQSIDAINMGSYRYFFQNIEFTFFGIGIFIFLSAFVINIFFLFVQHKNPAHRNPHRWMPYLLPIIFASATFFEGYAITSISIYALVAIGAFTFFLDTGSDIFHQRIKFTPRTVIFMALVIASSIFSALSTAY